MQLQWYRVSSIPVLLALLFLGFAAMLLIEILAVRSAGMRRAAQWIYAAALLGYLAVYLYLTFFSRSPSGMHRLRLEPLYGVRHLWENGVVHIRLFREIVLNIILYMPLGAVIPALLSGRPHSVRKTVWIGLAFTLATETAQYFLGMGLAETDDVINNMLGTLLGMLGFLSAHAAALAMADE